MNSFPLLTDTEIWRQFKLGDERAFSFIYEKYVDQLFSYGTRIVDDQALVKDCLQELFFNLWTKRERLGETDNIRYYLLCAARRLILRKAEAAISASEKVTAYLPSPAVEHSHEDHLITSEEDDIRSQALRDAFATLSCRQREVIHLKYYENLSFQDIARIMGVTERAVYKLVYRAIDALKDSHSIKWCKLVLSSNIHLVLLLPFLLR